jgi:hypothetical protein
MWYNILMTFEQSVVPEGARVYHSQIAAQLGAAIFESGLTPPHPLLDTARTVLGDVNTANPSAARLGDAEAVLVDLYIHADPDGYVPPTPHPLWPEEPPRPALSEAAKQAALARSIADARAAGFTLSVARLHASGEELRLVERVAQHRAA